MKILIFAEVYYPDVMGGGEFSTKQMAEGLAGRGHEVVVRCLGERRRTEKINGVRVKRKYIRGLSEHFLSNTKNRLIADPFTCFDKILRKRGDIYRSGRWYEYYRAVLIKEAPDIVHTVSPMSYLGRLNLWRAAHDLKIPVSHVCRGPNLLELKFLGGKLDRYNAGRNAAASRYLTALAAPSEYMLKRHNAAGIRGCSFNDVIPNAADTKVLIPSAELVVQKEDMILYAGEIKKEKGIDTLLQAAEGLGNVRLLLIGRGGLAESIKAGEAASAGRVEVTDWMEREELFKYMRRAKAVILPSEWEEPFGRILIEAIFNGTIAIGSDRGGIPEVLAHDEAYIFHGRDVEGLRRRIERVMSMNASDYVKETLKQQKAAKDFADDAYVDNWENFFLKQLR